MTESAQTPAQHATDRLRHLIDELMPGVVPHDIDGAPPPPDATLATPSTPAIVPPVEAARDNRIAVFAKPHDPHVFAELLSHVLGELPLDAMIHARHTPGVLPVPMTAAQAAQLVELLHGVGLQAAAVNVATLPDLANAAIVHHARCRNDGFEIVNLYGATAEVVAWPHVSVVAIGAVPGESLHHFVDGSLATAAPHPSTANRLDTHGNEVLELWMICQHPTAVYCIHHREFNYESLGDEAAESATANFEVFAQMVVNHATAARRTPSTRAYLAHDQRMKYAFGSSAELQQQALLQWVIGQSAP